MVTGQFNFREDEIIRQALAELERCKTDFQLHQARLKKQEAMIAYLRSTIRAVLQTRPDRSHHDAG